MDSETEEKKVIKETKSEFLNDILSKIPDYCHGRFDDKSIELDKSLVKSELDKWVWNKMRADDKIETNFDPRSESNRIFNQVCRSSGMSNYIYGEFIRCINKLMYRLMNDGDDVISGPYSAILYLLESGMKGGMLVHCEDGLELTLDDYVTYDEENGWHRDYDRCPGNYGYLKLNHLIHHLVPGIGFESAFMFSNSYRGPKNGPGRVTWSQFEEYLNCYIVMVDQLQDSLIGRKVSNDVDAANYYKNCLEYKFNSLYNLISPLCHNWSSGGFNEDSSRHTFYSPDEVVELEIDYSDLNIHIFRIGKYDSPIFIDLMRKFDMYEIRTSSGFNGEVDRLNEKEKELYLLLKEVHDIYIKWIKDKDGNFHRNPSSHEIEITLDQYLRLNDKLDKSVTYIVHIGELCKELTFDELSEFRTHETFDVRNSIINSAKYNYDPSSEDRYDKRVASIELFFSKDKLKKVQDDNQVNA